MAITPSNMLALGTKAPNFEALEVVSNKIKNLSQLSSDKATLIFFICAHCPFVIHLNEALAQLAMDYQKMGVNFIAISSNDVINYPQDRPELLKAQAVKYGFTFPYLYDETQSIAKAYDAACTPDFFLFDRDMKLNYRGQFDDSRPGNGLPITGKDLRNAIDATLMGQSISEIQKPSIGCNIKWKV